MSCSCKKRKSSIKVKVKAEDKPVEASQPAAEPVSEEELNVVVSEALDVDLPQCYLCAKKHLGEAWVYFEELHTGYPDRKIILVESFRVAEDAVRGAFILWQKVLMHLAMAGAELIGRRGEIEEELLSQHVEVANKIRDERIKLQDNPLYVPKFDDLLVEVQKLQYLE